PFAVAIGVVRFVMRRPWGFAITVGLTIGWLFNHFVSSAREATRQANERGYSWTAVFLAQLTFGFVRLPVG
ncbi:MAG: hypothetical protein MN733_27530, partial [Nitrososphaera sp.]|nr:hypothetical protein [Nitrososphaera sp.]